MTIRIGGLASGMDIDTMVKNLMTASKSPLNKLNQQKQLTEWKREGYRQVSTTLVSLNEKLSKFSLSSSINSKKATVTGASNVTATASGAATNSNMNISIQSLASATTTLSSKISNNASETSLSSVYSGSETSITVNGTQINFEGTDTISSLVTKINNSAAGVTARFDNTTGKLSFADKTTGSADVEVSGELLDNLFAGGSTPLSKIYAGTDKVLINGIEILVEDTDTITSFVTKINSSKAGVTAIYDATSGKLSLSNNATGNTDITTSGGLLTNIFGPTSTKTLGTDALVTINGLETKQSSNTFTVNGVTITATGVTPTGQTSQVSVTQDVDKLVETIQSFVEAYNATLSTLNQKTSEERYRKYLPLTTEQRADMSEDEIKLWESKAKSGMLKSDSIVDKTIGDMRAALMTDVLMPDGSKFNITKLGITTGNYSEKGKLIIDETKLRDALQANPENAYALFGRTDNSSTTNYTSSDGIFSRLKKLITSH